MARIKRLLIQNNFEVLHNDMNKFYKRFRATDITVLLEGDIITVRGRLQRTEDALECSVYIEDGMNSSMKEINNVINEILKCIDEERLRNK